MSLQLTWSQTARDADFHAAMVILQPARQPPTLHSHDFAEIMLVLDGAAMHYVNGRCEALAPGDLVYVRPSDCHTVRGLAGGAVRFINVAFPTASWEQFTALAGADSDRAAWDAAEHPPHIRLRGEQRLACGIACERALEAYLGGPSRLALCRFFVDLLPCMLATRSPSGAAPAGCPPWLWHACEQMRKPVHLQRGLPHFIQLCGVSGAHLSRTLHRHFGLTPTQYLNQLRLRQAATLLSSTSRGILDIALECGFENLSYFYRTFKDLFGVPPREYRATAARQILPDNHKS